MINLQKEKIINTENNKTAKAKYATCRERHLINVKSFEFCCFVFFVTSAFSHFVPKAHLRMCAGGDVRYS